ncbi:hypothetical protein BSKO_09258 [Bryopsis sp. KO-2023]|nr:hypothetical protein BSKO_09258 [Bryopsis sp. KO-2023]
MGCLLRCSCFSRTIGTSGRIARLSRRKIHTTATALIPFHSRGKRSSRVSPQHPCVFTPQRTKLSRNDLDAPWTVFAWGKEVEFSTAKVVESQNVTEQITRIMVDIGGLSSGYTTPGQFLQLKVGDGKPAFIAIASPPDANSAVVELLVKKQGEAAEALCGLSEGDDVSASPVMGKGFPVKNIPPEEIKTVFMFATGSGISPVKALIESGALQTGDRKDSILFYGARNKALMAMSDSLSSWEDLGVKVVPVFSEEGKGYVQNVFDGEKENLMGDPASTGVILCGQKEMCQAVTEMMTEAGVDKEKILLNF